MVHIRPTFRLHPLPQGYVLTSNEKIIIGDKALIKNRAGNQFLDTVSKVTDEGLWTCSDSYYYPYKVDPDTFCFKVITQDFDFASLSPKDQKEIGVYYEPVVEAVNRAWSYLNALGYFTTPTNEGRVVENLLIQARVRSQELLSDRRFTLEDMLGFYYWLKKSYGPTKPLEEAQIVHRTSPDKIVEMFIQSLSQPKSWEVEVEMGGYKLNDDGEPIGFPDMSKPKLTGGKVKVLRIIKH